MFWRFVVCPPLEWQICFFTNLNLFLHCMLALIEHIVQRNEVLCTFVTTMYEVRCDVTIKN